MSRVQLALNVSDLDAAVAFYCRLFATEPAKVRPGYANFAIADPPLKLVLIVGTGAPGSLNHLGVEVESTTRSRPRSGDWRTRGSQPSPRTKSRVATRYRTRCGSTARMQNRGRSTPCSRDVEMDAGTLRTVTPASDQDALCCDAAPASASRCC